MGRRWRTSAMALEAGVMADGGGGQDTGSLPTKSADGKLSYVGKKRRAPEDGAPAIPTRKDKARAKRLKKAAAGKTGAEADAAVALAAAPKAPAPTSVAPSRANIVALCEQIMADPPAAFRREKPKTEHGTAPGPVPPATVELLHDMCQGNTEMAVLALLSAAAVWSDVLPSDRIRMPTEAELSQRTSKEVLKRRKRDSNMLTCYAAFVKVRLSLKHASPPTPHHTPR